MRFEDIQTIDYEYYRSLEWILENDITDVLDLTFTATLDKFGEMIEYELKPGGTDIEVTEENKREYVQLLTDFRFSKNIEDQMNAFITGFNSIIPQHLIRIFDEKEIEVCSRLHTLHWQPSMPSDLLPCSSAQLLIGGLAEIDVSDWKANTEYRNGYHATHPQVLMFWEVVETWDNELRARMLQFVTGTSRVPVNGFRELHGSNGPQKFCVERVNATDGLARAHTCFNRLDLPMYANIDLMRDRLTFAMDNTAGFSQE